MTERDLNRAVARATGETVSFVKHLGFVVDGPLADEPDYSDVGPQVIDWDRLHAERSVPFFGRASRELVLA